MSVPDRLQQPVVGNLAPETPVARGLKGASGDGEELGSLQVAALVITSYSIHYTKLYDRLQLETGIGASLSIPRPLPGAEIPSDKATDIAVVDRRAICLGDLE